MKGYKTRKEFAREVKGLCKRIRTFYSEHPQEELSQSLELLKRIRNLEDQRQGLLKYIRQYPQMGERKELTDVFEFQMGQIGAYRSAHVEGVHIVHSLRRG